jgi:hypothetical protein
MNIVAHFEHRASSSRGKHEGESSFALCDRLSRTRDNSQRQLPTDHDYAVSTREYQTDQSSLKPAPTAARPVLEKQRQRQKQPHSSPVDTVTPYQGLALIELFRSICIFGTWTKMYGPPSDCKEKAEGEKTSLRKCIRPSVEHRAPGQDELRAYLSL